MPGSSNVAKDLVPGDEIQVHIKVRAVGSKARKLKRAVGGWIYMSTHSYKFGDWL